MRRLLEQEELVFGRSGHRVADVLRAFEHAGERAARAYRVGGRRELRQEQQPVAFERQRAAGCRHDPALGVGIRRVPAGKTDVVVELVGGIPAQHHVAEAEAAVEGGFEFLPREIFAAQHAVDVEHAELDVAGLALADDVLDIGRGFHLARLHAPPPLRSPPGHARA